MQCYFFEYLKEAYLFQMFKSEEEEVKIIRKW